MFGNYLMQKWLDLFIEKGNPLFAWRVFFTARKVGLPIPEEVMAYLDSTAYEIMQLAENPPKNPKDRPAALAKATGIMKDGEGRSVYTEYSNLSDRQIAIDAFFEIEKLGYEDEAFWVVGEKHNNISAATVRRKYKKYLKTWNAKAVELVESGKVGPLQPDGTRKIDLTVTGTAVDFREASIIFLIVNSRFHELP